MLTENISNNTDFLDGLGLRYVSDDETGFSRRRRGKGFKYLDARGNVVSNENILHRIQSLVIPPAWENVWICRISNGHLQATGRDKRERKQYKYHPKWTTARNETKFEHLKNMGDYLKILRPQVEADFNIQKLTREKVLATVIKVMEQTHIRIGNDEYAEENKSYGLTTLLNKHVDVVGSKVKFHFRGKSGIQHTSTLADARISRIIKKCQELPGQELFGFIDEEGEAQDVTSNHVNKYLRDVVGQSLTAKDFRTWGASVRAVELLLKEPVLENPTKQALKKAECEMIKKAASTLGNTVAVCRKYYVHPQVFQSYASGELEKVSAKIKKREKWLSREEKILLELVK